MRDGTLHAIGYIAFLALTTAGACAAATANTTEAAYLLASSAAFGAIAALYGYLAYRSANR